MKDLNETTNTAPSAGDAERSYRQALKLERDRERKHRKYTAKAATDVRTRSGRFWRLGDAPPGMPPGSSILLTSKNC
jgi:hypothetical protein